MSLFLGSCQEARKNTSRWSHELLDLVHISLGGLGVTWLLKDVQFGTEGVPTTSSICCAVTH